MIQIWLFCLTTMHHLFTIPVGVYCNNYYQFLLFTFSFGINVKWNLLYVFLLLKAGCFLSNMHFLVLLKTALQYVLHMSEWFEVKCYQVCIPFPIRWTKVCLFIWQGSTIQYDCYYDRENSYQLLIGNEIHQLSQSLKSIKILHNDKKRSRALFLAFNKPD